MALLQVLEGKLPTTYAFASVESREGQQVLRVRMYLDREGQSEAAGLSGTAALVLTALAGPKAAWWILRVGSTGVLHEYQQKHDVKMSLQAYCAVDNDYKL